MSVTKRGVMKQFKVLLADDDGDFLRFLSTRCRRPGVHVTQARDALDALTKIKNYHPDAVIMDVNMPHGNGLCVCEMLSHDEEWAKIPVIVVSGRTDPNTIRRCRELNIPFVVKGQDVWTQVAPFLAAELGIDMQSATAPKRSEVAKAVVKDEVKTIADGIRRWMDRESKLLVVGKFRAMDFERNVVVVETVNDGLTAIPFGRLGPTDIKVAFESNQRSASRPIAVTTDS